MNVTNILLGRPWLLDMNVHTDEEKNIRSFLWKGQRIKLIPLPSQTPSPSSSSPQIEESKSEKKEETTVVIVPHELQTMIKDIKDDIEQQDQETDDVATLLDEIACKTSNVEHISEEPENTGTKIIPI